VPRRLLASLALVAVTAALAACGSKKDDTAAAPAAQRLSLLLDYYPNADHAGIYAAQARGDFRRAGLTVGLQVPSDPATPLKLLQAGKVDLAISYEPELLLARDKGADLVSIGAIAQAPLTSIMALGSAKIHKPADLEGKTVGTAGIPYQSAYLKTILDAAGVDPAKVKEVNVGFNLVPTMLSKRVDATLGAFWNVEGVQLRRRHKAPTVIRMEKAGVPVYDELVLVARRDTVRDRGQVLRRFIQALQTGTEAVRTDPTAGVAPLVTANPDLDRGFELASVKATLPVLLPADRARPFGWQDPAQWRAYVAWMRSNGLLTRPGVAAAALTNEFLPGQGVQSAEQQSGG
jgi:putative hydroxymethylpyrimidine transport system substrate-binding protein